MMTKAFEDDEEAAAGETDPASGGEAVATPSQPPLKGMALWKVSKTEYEEVFKAGQDNPAYGESDLTAVVALLLEEGLGPTNTFLDVGSGLGKIAIAAAWHTPARCVGIELSPLRVSVGARALARLQQSLGDAHSGTRGGGDGGTPGGDGSRSPVVRVELHAGQLLAPEFAGLLDSSHIYFSIRSSPPKLLALVVERLLELGRADPDRKPTVLWAVNTPLTSSMLRDLKAIGSVRLTAVFEGKVSDPLLVRAHVM